MRVLYNVMPNDNRRRRLPLVGAGQRAVRLKRLAGAYALAFLFKAADNQLDYQGFSGAFDDSNYRLPMFPFCDTTGCQKLEWPCIPVTPDDELYVSKWPCS